MQGFSVANGDAWTPELDDHAPVMLKYKIRDQALQANPCRWREAEIAYDTGLNTFDQSIPAARAMMSSVPGVDANQWIAGMKIMLLLGRCRARLNTAPRSEIPFRQVLADAMELNRLEPNGVEAVEIFGVAMSLLASAPLPKENHAPGSPEARQAELMLADGWSHEKIAEAQASAHRMFMHAMAADVWAMLLEDVVPEEADLASMDPAEIKKWRAWRAKAEPSYAAHRKNTRDIIYQNTEVAARVFEDALALSPMQDHPRYLMASYLMALTYYRLGCRSPPLGWRPYHVASALRKDRIMEVVMLHHIRQGTDAGVIAAFAKTVKPGSRVRLSELQNRADLNGRTGTVLSFDADAGRFAVEVDRIPKGVVGDREVAKEGVKLRLSNLRPFDAF